MNKRIIAVLALAVFLLGSTVVAYSYWDNLRQDTTNSLTLGEGVRLEVPTSVQDSRALVPVGSFYADYAADYTTSYVFEYTLGLEADLTTGMEADLAVDITNFAVGGTSFLFNTTGELFTITVGSDSGAGTEAGGVWSFTDAFTDGVDESVVVTITITLADDGATGFDSTDYEAVAAKAATFALGFELTNSASSAAPATPLQ